MDTYIVVTIPDILSPIYSPTTKTIVGAPYEFKWIDHLGINMIKEVTINCGGLMLQRYTGEYLMAMVERDFSEEKEKFYDMIIHNEELNNPGYAHDRTNTYPNAIYSKYRWSRTINKR